MPYSCFNVGDDIKLALHLNYDPLSICPTHAASARGVVPLLLDRLRRRDHEKYIVETETAKEMSRVSCVDEEREREREREIVKHHL